MLNKLGEEEIQNEILIAVNTCSQGSTVPTLKDIFKCLEHIIVDDYDVKWPFAEYKSKWIQKVTEVLELNNIEYKKNNVIWVEIMELILDTRFKVANKNAIHETFPSPLKSSSLSTTSSVTDDNSTTEQNLLQEEDLANVKALFDGLEQSKMWKLKSGRYVEDVMKDVALQCTYEHPCLSLIRDPSDPVWESKFTEEELEEIQTSFEKPFPNLPPEMENLNATYKSITDPEELCRVVDSSYYNPFTQYNLKWMKSSMSDCIDSLHFKVIDNFDQIEFDTTLPDMWYSLSRAFNSSPIDAVSGDLLPSSSSAFRCKGRSLATHEQIASNFYDRTIDAMYICNGRELGCLECARTTKELMNTSLNLPIVMKRMFNVCAASSPTLVTQLEIMAFSIQGRKITVFSMDSPCGYVCRLNKSNTLCFPCEETQISELMPPILALIYRTRLKMESVYELLLNDSSKIDMRFGEEDTAVFPCFSPTTVIVTRKKRRNF